MWTKFAKDVKNLSSQAKSPAKKTTRGVGGFRELHKAHQKNIGTLAQQPVGMSADNRFILQIEQGEAL